ncbi:MAG: hypothetical protein RIE59_21040, partial [Imperialibacter sp.]
RSYSLFLLPTRRLTAPSSRPAGRTDAWSSSVSGLPSPPKLLVQVNSFALQYRHEGTKTPWILLLQSSKLKSCFLPGG